jgi:hypothetical protein
VGIAAERDGGKRQRQQNGGSITKPTVSWAANEVDVHERLLDGWTEELVSPSNAPHSVTLRWISLCRNRPFGRYAHFF